MEKAAYQTKTGATQFQPVMTQKEMAHVMFAGDGTGFCLACGAEADGVEPDARRYECEVCNALKVYGIEELLIMDLVKFTD